MKAALPIFVLLAFLLSSCAEQPREKSESGASGSGRVRDRWDLMDSAAQVQQQHNRAVQRRSRALENLAGTQN